MTNGAPHSPAHAIVRTLIDENIFKDMCECVCVKS